MNGAVVITVICTLVLTALTVKREVLSAARARAAGTREIPRHLWDTLIAGGHRIGPTDAALTLVEFGDFECPACGAFFRRMNRLGQLFPGEIAILFRHYPLEYHANAMSLAVASECAAGQGRFEAFHDSLFARQQERVAKPPLELARIAGVPDKAQFLSCMKDPTVASAITRDQGYGRQLNLNGTPSILAEGKLLTTTLDSARLDAMVQRARRAVSSRR